MKFTIAVDDPTDRNDEDSGPVTVGWLLNRTEAPVIYAPPSRVTGEARNGGSAKSIVQCPAVRNFESRFFEIAAPFDLHLGFQRDEDSGLPEIVNLAGDRSPIRSGKLASMLQLSPEKEWRHPKRPVFQIALPYIFVADQPVYISQLPPFAHFRKDPLPGLMIGGRFPIQVWPRPLMWAFEWHYTDCPVVLRRGEPLFYVQFETLPQDRSVRLVEAQRTPELEDYLEHISGAVDYVSQTFSLFEAAEARRPKRLIVPVVDGR